MAVPWCGWPGTFVAFYGQVVGDSKGVQGFGEACGECGSGGAGGCAEVCPEVSKVSATVTVWLSMAFQVCCLRTVLATVLLLKSADLCGAVLPPMSSDVCEGCFGGRNNLPQVVLPSGD